MSRPNRSDNAPRFRPGADHVESWFIRANHPTSPVAVWLKFTLLARRTGHTVAETWCSAFDGDDTLALKATHALADAAIEPDGSRLWAPGASFVLDGRNGAASGRIEGDRGSLAWDLRFHAPDTSLAQSMCLLPSRRLIDAPFPKNKLLTPFPLLSVSGTLRWNDRVVELNDWIGMQGHNWGTAHAPEYAWGHVVFTDVDARPIAVAEGATARIRLGGRLSPRMSLLTVRTEERELRFDRIVDTWRQRADIAFPEWSLAMRGADGNAMLHMRGMPERMVCLGYENPDGAMSYCLNSKTAEVSLVVNPADGEGLALASPHGGALEFLQPEPEPQVGEPC